MVLRTLAAVAAATAGVGAAVMRRWDGQAGKQVADLARARASDEWRHEERIAELETDLEESRELRGKLEKRLRAKRAELAGLRNEHASLLRRYATAETERASALEGRRLLEIETVAPSTAPALPPAPVREKDPSGTGRATGTAEAAEAESESEEATDAAHTEDGTDAADDSDAVEGADAEDAAEDEAPGPAPTVFSPEGSQLFMRAQAALARLDAADPAAAEQESPAGQGTESALDVLMQAAPPAPAEPAERFEQVEQVEQVEQSVPVGDTVGVPAEDAREDDAQGKPEAVDAHARATAAPEPPKDPATAPRPAAQQPPSGHFTVPTAVAVAPAAPPVRRPATEGGFDFFGAKNAPTADALEAVQNEDLADVVGQEALALHKAETEGGFKQAGAQTRGAGQVIDLTAHDETQQIDVQGLRSAAS
ncbi:hypothetical protein [Streptomyces actuosus]|nr:hypothetical protein [Streptomyces actuosus]